VVDLVPDEEERGLRALDGISLAAARASARARIDGFPWSTTVSAAR
jgi:hypothetical protein